ncbi:efflux RND transporter periplasmic adaptor subunit [Candidatus Neomarinimicrobiota bacterium]
MKLNNLSIFSKKIIQWLKAMPYRVWILVAAAFLIGLLVRSPGDRRAAESQVTEQTAPHAVDWWTCSMHPHIKLPEPGQCPICFMDLIALESTPSETGLRELKMSPTAMALAGIQTAPVSRGDAKRDVRLSGKVELDETQMGYITAWIPGRLERLYVDYTGITVQKGDHMVELYSPDLYSAQEELLQALRRVPSEGQSQVIGQASALATLLASREKLRLLGLTDEQIQSIEERGSSLDRLTIYSPVSGVVIHKNAAEGMYVQTGTRIYTIADLSRVWIILDAYESDLSWLHFGHEVEFQVEALPGQEFKGRIAFINPMLDTKTRTVKVRLSVPNPDGLLKPGMFVRAVVHSVMGSKGRAVNPSMAGKWVSPMHPEVVKDKPGTCDVCGMDLVKAEDLGIVSLPTQDKKPLLVPATAVLQTGERAIVYVKIPGTVEPVFESREVVLGSRTKDHFVVIEGLVEGEEVVVNGNFKIDSAMQIAAKPSMMNPQGGVALTGHAHHGIDSDIPKGSAPLKNTANPTMDMANPMIMDVNPDFLEVLSELYDRYFEAQLALSRDNMQDAAQALRKLRLSTQAITADKFGMEGHAARMWQDYQQALMNNTEHLPHWTSIESLRKGFEAISETVISLGQSFGHTGGQTFREIYCSMAFDNTGASWLQTDKQVQNPYFGAKMLRCGEVRDVSPPRTADEAIHQGDSKHD